MPRRSREEKRSDFMVEDLDNDDGDTNPKRWRPWRSKDTSPGKDSSIEKDASPEKYTVDPSGSSTTSLNVPSNAGKLVPNFIEGTIAKAEIIPIFDPEKSEIFAYQWLSKIEQLATIHNWTENTKSYYMQSRLGGMAKVWHASMLDYNLSWDDWKREVLKAFPYNVDYADSLREMLFRKKNINESMAQYYYQKNAMLTKLDILGEKAVACLIDGLPMHMKTPARAGNFASPSELYSKFLSVMEDKPKQHQLNRPRFEPSKSELDSGNNKDSRRSFNCFLCGEQGHTVRRCPKNSTRPTCSKCGKVGHMTENCWSKVVPTINTRPPHTTISVISSEVNETYFKQVRLNDIDFRAYFDSGAKINVASMNVSKQLGSTLLPCDYVISGFGGSVVQAKGQHNVTLTVNNIHIDTTMIIVDSDVIHPEVILGQPIINHPQIKFTVIGNNMTIERNHPAICNDTNAELLLIDNIYPSDGRILILCSEDIIIPPNTSKIISVECVGASTDMTIFVDSCNRFYDDKDFSIPPTILSANESMLSITNSASSPLLLNQHILLARGIQCTNAIYEFESPTSTPSSWVLSLDVDKIQCETTDPKIRADLVQLLQEFSDCFSSNTEELGCTDKIKMKIDLSADKPVCYRPYRLSEAEKLVVREKVADLLKNNVIRESNSPFSSPIVLVRKKNGDYRLCVDFRKLNSITIKDRYPLPIIEEQVEKLGGKRYFTSLDMSQGFYQIPLEEESMPKTGFITPEGHYEFMRMPFGLANSPSVYQRLMDKILGSLRHEKVLPYMDDLLIASVSEAEALETLRMVLGIIRDAKLTLNLSKCNFLQREIQYLGYEISQAGIRPGAKKIDAVTNYQPPTNIHELRMFLGLTSYFRKFVRGYALIAHDLYKLLKKDVNWEWGRAQQEAFDKLKVILTSRPVLALYNSKAETEVHTDASSKGIAGILLQKDNGVMRPVAYFSRKTSREESVYHSYELECLAVVESLKRFRIYLAGIDFKVVTDCAAVRQTFEKRDLLPRIARWWLSIQEYSFTVAHRPGSMHKHVDALSRTPNEHPVSPSVLVLDLMDWIVCMQNQDPRIRIIRDKLEGNDNDPDIQNNYTLKDNKVYRKCIGGQLRLVVPKYCKWNIMRKYHDDIGHPGLKKCDLLVKENCWFPGMTRFIRKYVNGCMDCAFKRGQYGKKEGSLHPIEKLDKPLDTIHIDHAGPFCKSRKGYSYLFVAVDSFTKFTWAKPCKTTKSVEAIEKLKEIFSDFGYPRRIISDSGSAFTSKTFRDFCIANQIKHVKNAIASPRSNGQVERYNRTLIEAINKSTNDESNWDTCLGNVTWGMNNTINATTGFSPYRLMFNASRSRFREIGNNTMDSEETVKQNNEKAGQSIEKKMVDMKKRFDAKRKLPTVYNVKDLVLWEKAESAKKDVRRKLKEKFSGPYMIKKCLGNDRYVITALKGMKGYKKFTAVVASDALRKFTDMIDSDSESGESNVDSTEELIDLLEG